MSYVLYCFDASRTENTWAAAVWGEILQTIWVENAPVIFKTKSFVVQLSTCPNHFVPSQLILHYKFKFVNFAENKLFIVDRHEQADGNDGFLQSFHIPGKSVHLYSLQVNILPYPTVIVTLLRYYSAKFLF